MSATICPVPGESLVVPIDGLSLISSIGGQKLENCVTSLKEGPWYEQIIKPFNNIIEYHYHWSGVKDVKTKHTWISDYKPTSLPFTSLMGKWTECGAFKKCANAFTFVANLGKTFWEKRCLYQRILEILWTVYLVKNTKGCLL